MPPHPLIALPCQRTAQSTQEVRFDHDLLDHNLEVLLESLAGALLSEKSSDGGLLPVAWQLFAGLLGLSEWDSFELSVIFLKTIEFAVFRETRPIKVGLSEVAVRL